jgi:hypothetical protein
MGIDFGYIWGTFWQGLSDWGVFDLLTKLDLPGWFGQTTPTVFPLPVLAGVVVLAVAVSIPDVTWRVFGLFTTLVHELGHATAAVISGGGVTGITVDRNHGGSTRTENWGFFATVFTAFAGYPAPAVTGLGLIWAVTNGYSPAATFAATIIVVFTILFIRNWVGAGVVAGTAVFSAALWFYGTAEVQSYVLLVVAIALLVGSARGFLTVARVHLLDRDRLATSDAYILFRETLIPSPIWLLLFAGTIAGSVWFAGRLLLG